MAATNNNDQPFEAADYALYAVTVACWSASWYALSLQPGIVANEVSLVYRFVIAAGIMLVWVLLTSAQIRFSLRQHIVFATTGIFIFSSNFLLFYYGSQYLVSGLLSVVFSTAALTNLLISSVATRTVPSAKIVLAILIGIIGIGLIFQAEIASRGFGDGVLLGLAFCVCGTLSFSLGSVVSGQLQSSGKVPLVSANMWGMFYGICWAAILAVVQGKPFNWDPRPEYLWSLIFLAVVSTVIAFASYLKLVARIGSGRAGYATVIFPIFALLISTWLEGYQWGLLAVLGLTLVIAGNVLITRGSQRKRA
ncbi:MAG: DMT family transporter [Pseudomonadota bacterium]